MPTDLPSAPLSIQERRLHIQAQFERLRTLFNAPEQRTALVAGVRELYADLFLLEFLEREAEARHSMENTIRARMMQALESSVAETAVPTRPIETAPASSPSTEVAYRSEIVVVPIPQGPPVTRKEEPQTQVESPPPPIFAEPVAHPVAHPMASEEPIQRPPTAWELGLNDRIAFTQQLFGGRAEDYHRALSQLGTLGSASEARTFVNEQLRPDYNWSSMEAQEQLERLFELIEARFGGSSY